jgi:hypothetical protein
MPDPRRVRALAVRIAMQVSRAAAKGVDAAAIFLAARVKETLSVPAPRKKVVTSAGDIEYRATVRAIPGAPPRKLSGKMRQSVTYQLSAQRPRGRGPASAVVGLKARSKRGVNYPRILEYKGHPYLMKTARQYRRELTTIVGRSIKMRVI